MSNDKDLTCKTPLEDLRMDALKHYEEASSAIHHWSSFVESAIKAYNPDNQTPKGEEQGLKYFIENTNTGEWYFVELPDTVPILPHFSNNWTRNPHEAMAFNSFEEAEAYRTDFKMALNFPHFKVTEHEFVNPQSASPAPAEEKGTDKFASWIQKTIENNSSETATIIRTNSYVLTGEELLELKKQWADEAWKECDVAQQTLPARKNEYIDNLTL